MILNLPLSEASAIIKEKSGQVVSLKAVGAKTVRVGYDAAVELPIVGKVQKRVDIDATIEELKGEDLHLTYAAQGAVVSVAIKSLLAAAGRSKYKNLIEPRDHNRLVVHLGQIEEVHKTLRQIDVKDIVLKNDSAVVSFLLK